MHLAEGISIDHSVVASPSGCSHAFALLEVSVPLAPSTVDALAVLYSFVPWVGCFLLAAIVVHRKRDEVYAARTVGLFLTAMLTINELIFKKLLREPRPEQSCLRSHGMPRAQARTVMLALPRHA
ncbi:transmembrane protein, putative [Bodo saltans]|uniref:Transmembrane protein, putative n=1 Tax=Bodo saltans TaxID=75058 RepID=A0A0S4IKR9_BODSA|nr:transmembrane protein, putative [Bodo saltans]|eukprot:CUE67560.1 transmembrane protein, putative [Bodo saltans]